MVGNLYRLPTIPDDIVVTFLNDLSYYTKIYLFKKLFKKNVLYTCKLYQGSKQTESFCVKYFEDGHPCFGFIQYYLKLNNCNCSEICECPAIYLAVLKKCFTENNFHTNLRNGVLSSIKKCLRQTNNTITIDVASLICVCFHVRIEDTEEDYIIEPVNMLENE